VTIGQVKCRNAQLRENVFFVLVLLFGDLRESKGLLGKLQFDKGLQGVRI
jgi:hypothetical protein